MRDFWARFRGRRNLRVLAGQSLPAKVHEDPPEVLRVLLDPEMLRRWTVLLEEAKHVLFQLAGALAGDDLDQRRLLRRGLIEDPLERTLDLAAPVVDVMQVQRQLHVPRLRPTCATISSTIRAGSTSADTICTRSSGAGDSSVRSWLSSSSSGKKCPILPVSRRTRTSLLTCRKNIVAAGRPRSSSSR